MRSLQCLTPDNHSSTFFSCATILWHFVLVIFCSFGCFSSFRQTRHLNTKSLFSFLRPLLEFASKHRVDVRLRMHPVHVMGSRTGRTHLSVSMRSKTQFMPRIQTQMHGNESILFHIRWLNLILNCWHDAANETKNCYLFLSQELDWKKNCLPSIYRNRFSPTYNFFRMSVHGSGFRWERKNACN